MRRFPLAILLAALAFASCDLLLPPDPTDEKDLFPIAHTTSSGPRIVTAVTVTLSWPEVPVEEFARYVIFRSTDDAEEPWEERGALLYPLTLSYTDTVEDDRTVRYKVRVEDVHGNYRDGITAPIPFRTTSVSVPAEFASLQAAFDSDFVDDGDTIAVEPGAHEGPFQLLGKQVRVEAVMGAEATSLHTTSETAEIEDRGLVSIGVVTLDRGTLAGFTITGGGGVRALGTARVTNCVAVDIRTYDEETTVYEFAPTGDILDSATYFFRRAGIVAEDSAVVERCVARGCRKLMFGAVEGMGGGVVASGRAVIRQCVIKENHSDTKGGGGALFDEASLVNCIVKGNSAAEGGGGLFIGNAAAPRIVNCVLYGNSSFLPNGAWGAVSMEGVAQFLNTIVWGNSAGTMESQVWRDATYCDIEGIEFGTGNFSLPPRFTDAENGDFRLAGDSPCIDAGSPEESHDDPDGSRNDLGAYGGPYGEW